MIEWNFMTGTSRMIRFDKPRRKPAGIRESRAVKRGQGRWRTGRIGFVRGAAVMPPASFFPLRRSMRRSAFFLRVIGIGILFHIYVGMRLIPAAPVGAPLRWLARARAGRLRPPDSARHGRAHDRVAAALRSSRVGRPDRAGVFLVAARADLCPRRGAARDPSRRLGARRADRIAHVRREKRARRAGCSRCCRR